MNPPNHSDDAIPQSEIRAESLPEVISDKASYPQTGAGNDSTPKSTRPEIRLGGVHSGPAPMSMTASLDNRMSNPIVPGGGENLSQTQLSGDRSGTISIVRSRELEVDPNVGHKRKRGPRPKDVIKTKQMNLELYLSTDERRIVKAGRPSSSSSVMTDHS